MRRIDYKSRLRSQTSILTSQIRSRLVVNKTKIWKKIASGITSTMKIGRGS